MAEKMTHRERLQEMLDSNQNVFSEYIERLNTPIKESDKEKDEMQALTMKIAMRKELDSIVQSIASYEAQLDMLDGKKEVVKAKPKSFTPESIASQTAVK